MNHGMTTRAGLFTIKRLPQARRPYPRMGVIVSKKAAKHATTRNRIRRRIYELLRAHQGAITEPMDIVVIVHDRAVATLPPPELAAQFLRAFKNSLASPFKPNTHRRR